MTHGAKQARRTLSQRHARCSLPGSKRANGLPDSFCRLTPGRISSSRYSEITSSTPFYGAFWRPFARLNGPGIIAAAQNNRTGASPRAYNIPAGSRMRRAALPAYDPIPQDRKATVLRYGSPLRRYLAPVQAAKEDRHEATSAPTFPPRPE